VLEHAASLLSVEMTCRPISDDGYTEEVRIGDQIGGMHDGCFIVFDEPNADFEAALLAGISALQATYLGRESVPAEALKAVHDRLRDGWSVEMEANPRDASLRIRAFPIAAGWWTRATAPRQTFAMLHDGSGVP